ncbi:porin family protein [Flagellimonas marina]|uniref:Porin family protein n=1 Tax=Flagellimonas marina TaxID=1775168 RepID=A0ABV8PM97_9FLAO
MLFKESQTLKQKVKKTNLLIALAIVICTTASAQFNNAVGIKAGANYSQFRPDFKIEGYKVLDFQAKMGYYAGGFFNVGVSERASIRPELLFANQGTRTSSEIVFEKPNEPPMAGEVVTIWNELVLLLPINFRYKVVERLYVEAGLQAGYAIKRTEVVKKIDFDPSLEGHKETHSDIDRFDLGLNGGLSFDATDILELHFRYSYGLLERDNTYKTSVFNLGLGIKI